jgi:hypothetical protein
MPLTISVSGMLVSLAVEDIMGMSVSAWRA